jgi:hypothetical protein
MIILFLVVLILFSIVKTKIIHYSSLAYFPLTYLGARFLYALLIEKSAKIKSYQYFLFFLIGTISAAAISIIPYLLIFKKEMIMRFIEDPFAIASLEAKAGWQVGDCFIGIAFFIILSVLLILLFSNLRKLTLVIAIFCLTAIFAISTMLTIVPKIEKQIQEAAISFYEGLQGKDCYTEVLGFKSYAYLFYTKKQPLINKQAYNKDWLLTGKIDKPTWFVCKIQHAEKYTQKYHLVEMKRENGFVFLLRNPG